MACEEKQRLLSENAHDAGNTEELKKAQANVTALTEERDQLLCVLESLREEKIQIKNLLEEKDDLVRMIHRCRKTVSLCFFVYVTSVG